MKIKEEEYLEKCKEFLDYFNVKYDKDVLYLTDGGNSCIMNPNSDFYELFGGHSINGVAQYVATKMNKKIKWLDYK